MLDKMKFHSQLKTRDQENTKNLGKKLTTKVNPLVMLFPNNLKPGNLCFSCCMQDHLMTSVRSHLHD